MAGVKHGANQNYMNGGT